MPRHRSLVVRLLGTSVLIVVVSGATAAWLAAKTATRAVQQERGESLAGDAGIYDALLGFAATHRGWDGVEPLVRRLGAETGRRITLTTTAGAPIAATDPAAERSRRPAAVLDPLYPAVDERATGPYRLTERDRSAQRVLAERRLGCLRRQGIDATLDVRPSGRSVVRIGAGSPRQRVDCTIGEDRPFLSELLALKDLQAGLEPCLRNLHLPDVQVSTTDFTWTYLSPDASGNSGNIQDCVDGARRDQLRGYVAAAARLYLDSPVRPPTPVFDLSAGSTLRIAGATAFVLVVAAAVSLLVGSRLVRPLRALTAAADRSGSRPAPVAIARNDEIGRLAAAFNDLARRSEHSEEQRRTMVNDIAHELRSPLTNIRSWLTAAQDGLADLDDELVRLLLEESGLLQHIVDDLADLADADAGTLTLQADENYVADLLVQVTDAHRGAAERDGVGVHLSVPDDLRAVVDPARFRQIAGNLLGNAIRHTPAGGRVEVRADAADGMLTVAVEDTGTGIAAADLPYVFDRFWRADRARTRATGGTGLGLSIARKLAEAHGGELTAASTPGVGSTFTLRLPALSGPATPRPPARSRRRSKG